MSTAPEVCCRIGDKVDVDLHTQQVTLLPTSTEGLSIPPALLFTKDQTQGENSNGDCNENEIKVVNSDVSLPKDDKQLCWVNKLQLGN